MRLTCSRFNINPTAKHVFICCYKSDKIMEWISTKLALPTENKIVEIKHKNGEIEKARHEFVINKLDNGNTHIIRRWHDEVGHCIEYSLCFFNDITHWHECE